MNNRTRNLAIITAVLALLVGAGALIATKPTRLGLDLKGGVELVYQARPTPKVPEVTPQAVDDAIETIRKRTDALGVSEPEIQRSGADQISIGLPDVKNAERAERQVGTTAQLQFYDWEPNLIGEDGKTAPEGAFLEDYRNREAPLPLEEAVLLAGKARPQAEEVDVPPGGVEPEIERRFAGDKARILQYYDQRNDSAGGDRYYLFGPDKQLVAGPDLSCEELLADFRDDSAPPAGGAAGRTVPEGSECSAELRALGNAGPPNESRALKVPRGIAVVQAERPPQLADDRPFNRYHVLEDDSELSGSDIKNPEQNTDQQTNEPIVTFEFTDTGREAFASVTKRIAQRGAQVVSQTPGLPPDDKNQKFAITLDNEIVSLATIDFQDYPDGIDGRTGTQINGIGDIRETQDLAESLRIGALPVELKLISKTQVSATLGKKALDQGLLAGGVGFALTMLFLVAFYRVLGVVAGMALAVYAVLLFALVELIPITLTLPGIAGLILTLGVAADANIVIFERIKEEARAGRSIPAAIAGGYAKALRTIVDANVVTIGVAFILFMLATAGVKGFAFTLGVGTLVSLFTAVLATSAILGSMSRSRLLRSRHALGAGGEGRKWTFDFMGASRWFFSMSGVILAIGALAIAGLGINFGIDFESGTRLKTALERPASVDSVRDSLPAGMQEAEVQEVADEELGANAFQISTETLPPEQVSRVENSLEDNFGVREIQANSIGPTFGAQIARTAVIAIIASLILISIYIGLRFEFKFAVPVLIALAHDLLITAGVYALLEREVTSSTVAALLTILGYSLYDTIIVFDRIRENVPRMPRATFSQIVNRSMSEVIVRSLVTSFSTLLPITALMLFGGETLKDFGFALLVGVASGTYSSVFIASPVLTAWKERESTYRRRRQVVAADHGGVIPPYPETALGDDDAASRPGRRRAPAGAGAPVSPEPPAAVPAAAGSDGEPETARSPARAASTPAPAAAAQSPAASTPSPAASTPSPAAPQSTDGADGQPAERDGGDGGDGGSVKPTDGGPGNGASAQRRAARQKAAARRAKRKKHGRR